VAALDAAQLVRGHRRPGGDAAVQPGRAAQVDPVKPILKAPKTKRLKLKSDEPPSNFAFKFNLRRYNREQVAAFGAGAFPGGGGGGRGVINGHLTPL